jgi:hypothetical protein
LKLPKEKKSSYKKRDNNIKVAESDDSWKDLEQQVADRLNHIPTSKDARRSRASGALWFEKLDVIDSILGPECKERKGNEIAEGADKSISIKRSWLEKAKKEAQDVGKVMILPFRFKRDNDKIYSIQEFEDLALLVTMIKSVTQENEMLLAQSEILQKRIKEYEMQDKSRGL